MRLFMSRNHNKGFLLGRKVFQSCLLLCIILLFGIALAGCQTKSPLRVAVMTKLEAGSLIGSSEVDAAHLFLNREQIESIEIVPYNDGWEPEKIASVYKEAREKGINVFITSHTSTCALELKKLTDLEQEEVLILVTGSTTALLSGLDDNNIRFIQDLISEQTSIGNEVNAQGYQHLVILRDLDNSKYTEPALENFLKVYKGKYTLLDFSIKDLDIGAIQKQLEALNYDAVYTLIGGNQTVSGSLAQLAYQVNPDITVYFTPWNNGSTVIETAGEAIEVCVMANHYQISDETPGVADYFAEFKEKYSYSPTYNSLHVYRAMEVLSKAVATGHTKPVDIRKFILETATFETRFGTLKLSPTGDTEMPLYFIKNIKDVF